MKNRAWYALAAMLAAVAAGGASAQGALENPQPGATESGIAAITGWHCTARQIEVRVDGVSLGNAGIGTSRGDTQSVCGRSDTGFSLLYNYALLRGGTHRIDAYADGALFGSATFKVGYLGGEFVTGLAASHFIPDFPAKGQGTHLVWAQSKQAFVVTGTEALLAPSLVGTYAFRHVSFVNPNGVVGSTLQPGYSVAGTLVVRSDRTYAMTLTLTGPGGSTTETSSGPVIDNGHYLIASGETSAIIERGDTLTFHSVDVGTTPVESGALSLVRTGGAAAADAQPLALEGATGEGGPRAALARAVARLVGAAR